MHAEGERIAAHEDPLGHAILEAGEQLLRSGHLREAHRDDLRAEPGERLVAAAHQPIARLDVLRGHRLQHLELPGRDVQPPAGRP